MWSYFLEKNIFWLEFLFATLKLILLPRSRLFNVKINKQKYFRRVLSPVIDKLVEKFCVIALVNEVKVHSHGNDKH